MTYCSFVTKCVRCFRCDSVSINFFLLYSFTVTIVSLKLYSRIICIIYLTHLTHQDAKTAYCCRYLLDCQCFQGNLPCWAKIAVICHMTLLDHPKPAAMSSYHFKSQILQGLAHLDGIEAHRPSEACHDVWPLHVQGITLGI